MILPPEQLVVHARVYLNRHGSLPYQLAAQLMVAFEESLHEVKRLRERVVDLEQERFE